MPARWSDRGCDSARVCDRSLYALAVLMLASISCASASSQAAGPGAGPLPRAQLGGIDVYGTSDELAAQIHHRYDARIDTCIAAFAAGESQRAASIRDEIVFGVRSMGDFAFVKLAVFDDLAQGARHMYAILDLVEARDRERRMSFSAAPQRDVPDPGGLIAAWGTFFQTGLELVQQGKLPTDRAPCPTFHCPFGQNPALTSQEQRFVRDVPAAREALVTVLRESRDAEARAAAAFVLAYERDGKQLVEDLVPSVRDPSDGVRNNVMRVFGEVANVHPEIAIPLDPLLTALDYPTSSDRNKASFVLAALAESHPELRATIASRAGATLLAMLKTQWPGTHRFAHAILKTVSGQSLGERDYAAWQAWLDHRPASP